MSIPDHNNPIPPNRQDKRFLSIPALGFILASLLLASVLAIVTWHNLDREEQFMEGFLLKQAETLIRAFEAGARTSMMMGPRGGNLETLVTETAREETIAYIFIQDEKGHPVANAGNLPEPESLPPASKVLSADQPQARFLRDQSGQRIYEIAKEFSPLTMMPRRMEMMPRWRNWRGMQGNSDRNEHRQIIYLGLYTEDFDAARAEDVKQSLILLGILFLLSSGGLYALFLSHKSQVTKAALENMELYTDNVIHSMPAGLISIDTERRIVTANSTALEIFARSETDMRGKTLQQLMGTEECSLAPLLRAGKEFIDQPIDCLRQDGETVPLKVSASNLRDREGDLRGMVLILRDQREIKAMEDALERSRRHAALGQMAAGVAHEIRNPLGTLRGFAQYFSRNAKLDDQAKEYADLMVGEVDRLNRTVSALLQFSRPRDPEIIKIDFSTIAQKSLTFVQEEADNKQIDLKLQHLEPGSNLYADPDLLQQVLLNLLQNSIAASDTGGSITLGGKISEEIHLWVQDTGKGISQEEQAKMFNPFYTTKKDGTGLGLAVVQQIVEQHHGRIEVNSQPGQGTCITIILPRREEQA
ncbi:two-component system, NtrC family, sensor histidine kinase HydH [Malonomonas rubra DSM 5091]|uniref:histidine kinase n=1 Tax=Malonomonas rubra DSM 5091 TaxID=1122189 RepID=A0A1M6JPI4_MALRU|nr:ATP-binding protein [Malonomonas rubra]SHJ48621.1 two-component system, NtrC family, sensor histidine kinase HydH [Malonomonas rubra DSM 5091]